MEVSNIFPIFATSFGEMDDDIEESNLALTRQRICKIHREWAKSLKAASRAVAFILLSPPMESAHVNTCRCGLISFLLIRVLQNLLAKDVRRLTPAGIYVSQLHSGVSSIYATAGEAAFRLFTLIL